MEFFTDGAFVRLESRVMKDKYIHADADWQRISLRPNVGIADAGAEPALNSVWWVQRWQTNEEGNTYVALQNAAYGRYLSFSRSTSNHGFRTTQMNRDDSVGLDLNTFPWMWTLERLPYPDQDYVSLRYSTGCYLRANGSKYLFRNNIRVTTDTDLEAPSISKTMHWKVHQVETTSIPRVHPLTAEDRQRESGVPYPARTIRHVLANAEGGFDQNHHHWHSFAFNDTSVIKLRNELRRRQKWDKLGAYMLCMRPGSHGRLMPLVTYALPDSSESMNIVVLRKASPVAKALQYPAAPHSG